MYKLVIPNFIFPDDMALTERSTLERRILLDDIFRFLVSQFPDIELVLFGSTNNGFGLRGSDVDVSVRFKNRPIRKVKATTVNVKCILITNIHPYKLKLV